MAAHLLLLLQLLACCPRGSGASRPRLQPSPLRVSCPGPHGRVSQRQDNEHRVSCLWNSTVTLRYGPAPRARPEVEWTEEQPPPPPLCFWYLDSACVRNTSSWSGQVVLQAGHAPPPGASSLLTVQCSSASCAAPECFHHNVSIEISVQDVRLFVLWPQTRLIRVWQPVELGWCARLKSARWQYRFSSGGGSPSTLLLPSGEYQDTPPPAIYPTAELQQTCATYHSYRLTVRYGNHGIHVASVTIEQMPQISLSLSLKVEPDLLHVLSIGSKLLSVSQQPLSLSWRLQPLTMSILAYRLVDTQAIGGWLRSYSSFMTPSNFCAISTPQSKSEIVVASVYFHVDGKRFEELSGELHLLNGTLILTAGRETPTHINLHPGKTNSSTYIFRYSQGTFYTSKENNSPVSTDCPNTRTVFYQHKELSYLLTIEFVTFQGYKFNMYLYMNQKRALFRSLAERDLEVHVFSSRPSFLQNFTYLVWFIPTQHPMLQCEWTFHLQLLGTQKDHIVQNSTYTYSDHVKNATRFVRRSALPFDAENYTGFVAKVNCTGSAPTPALLRVRVNNYTEKTIEAPVVCQEKKCRITLVWIQRTDRRAIILYRKRGESFYLFVRLLVECQTAISVKPFWRIYPVRDTKTAPDWSKPMNSSAFFGIEMIHLTVPSNTLDYGLYLFYFTVEVMPMTTREILRGQDRIYVQIERANLMANISGGEFRMVGFSESWTLDGSASSDPDSQEGSISFTWYCTRDLRDYNTMKFRPENKCHPSQRDLHWLTPSGPIQRMAPESLPGRSIYYFRLVIQKGRRISHADQVVEVAAGPPLRLNVACIENCGSTLIPTERFALSGKCLNCKPINKPVYYWSLLSGSGREISFDWSSKTSTGRSGAYMSIHALTFTRATPPSYTLHLRVSTWDGRTSEYSRKFRVNTPPRAGRCSLNPRRGIAFLTKFVVKCKGFSGSNLPLTYKVIVASNVPETTKVTSVVENTFGIILYFGSEPKSPLSFLPPGAPSHRYTLTIYVQVRDSLGAFTQVTLHTSIRKPANPQLLPAVFHELLASASSLSTAGPKAGDNLRAGYLAYLAASILNYVKTVPTPQLPQAKLRETLIKTALNISVKSIMGVNQVVAVLAAVTEEVDEVNIRSQGLAIAKLREATGILKIERNQIHWSEEAEIQTSGILRCLSNILRSDLTDLKNVSADGIEQVLSIMEGVTEVAFRGKVPGEIETLMETKDWNITLKKDEAWNTANAFPTSDTCRNCFYPTLKKGNVSGFAQDTVFSTAIFEFDKTPFPWLGYTAEIRTMVLGFKMAETKANGDLVGIVPERADVFLARKGNGSTTFPLIMGPDTTESYTTGGFRFEVSKNTTSIYFQITTKLKATFKVKIFTGANVTQAQPTALFTASHNMSTVASGNETASAECSIKGPYIVCLPKSLLTAIAQANGTDRQNISIVLETHYVVRYPNRRLVGIYVFNDRCLFLDGVGSPWSRDTCKVGSKTDWQKVHCACDTVQKLRSVSAQTATNIKFLAAKVVVLPNTVDLGRNLIAHIPRNPLTLITVASIFAVYFLLCIWAIIKDRAEKEIKYIMVLPDNSPSDEGSYLVTLYTGSRCNAGTKAAVALQLIGEDGKSKFRCLWHHPSPAFQRGSTDCFLITTKKDLGDIHSFRVRLNNDGSSPSWFLSRAEIENTSTRKAWSFMCRKWLSCAKDDPPQEWKFSVTDPRTPLPRIDYFLINFNKRMIDYHLWFSIFAPTVTGAFTRFQRLSTCLAVILFNLLVNIMFFNADKIEESPIYLRYLRSIAVGIECALLTIPVEMLIIALFKYSQKEPTPVVTKMYPEAKPEFWNNCVLPEKVANVIETEEQMTDAKSPPGATSSRRRSKSSSYAGGSIFLKRRKSLSSTIRELRKTPATEPVLWWWCVPVSWALVVVITTLSSFFIVLYGLSYGYQTSREWLIASGASFLQNVFLHSILKSVLFSALSTTRPRYCEDITWVTQEKHVEINAAEGAKRAGEKTGAR
ncbi:polycystic kidney disease and receptor for egg jelly-related protein [Chiroxiphia lanceolata]|uniref:polycystic kidney disease and receptor for egg jelly-related protein n=1 Tax=Chiroxiphia lanceolata TaxID=296741 RepID=UPI0013CECB22|nr:polycystic kidney disease and receptor for egg jelly-related protein [Chiroxiphia lanceolata]